MPNLAGDPPTTPHEEAADAYGAAVPHPQVHHGDECPLCLTRLKREVDGRTECDSGILRVKTCAETVLVRSSERAKKSCAVATAKTAQQSLGSTTKLHEGDTLALGHRIWVRG